MMYALHALEKVAPLKRVHEPVSCSGEACRGRVPLKGISFHSTTHA